MAVLFIESNDKDCLKNPIFCVTQIFQDTYFGKLSTVHLQK